MVSFNAVFFIDAWWLGENLIRRNPPYAIPQHWLRVCVALNTDEALKGRRFRSSDSTRASGVENRPRSCAVKQSDLRWRKHAVRSLPGFLPEGDRSTRPRTSLAPQRVPSASSLKPVVLACLRQQSGWQGAVLPAKNAAGISPRARAAGAGINGGVRGSPSPGGLWRCQRPARGQPWCRSAPSFRRRAHPQDLTSGHLPSDSGRKACSPGTVAMIL